MVSYVFLWCALKQGILFARQRDLNVKGQSHGFSSYHVGEMFHRCH
jgi:hypothetical protein